MRHRYILLTVCYCLGIFWLSSQPDPPLSDVAFPAADKLAHAALYGGLAGLVSLGMRRSNKERRPQAQFLVPIVFAVLYGITDEIHQVYVPFRSFSMLDIAADTTGAVSVQSVLCLWLWKLHLRPRPRE